MGEVNDIGIVSIINDILKYKVSLTVNKIKGTYYVTLTWLGKLPNGRTAMGNANGSHEKFYHALETAYYNMLAPPKEERQKESKDSPESKGKEE